VSDSAPAQFTRLVGLLAGLSQRDSGEPVSYRAAARRLGVAERTVRDDLETLVRLTDDYKSWLASLSVALLADGFVAESRGPFRRPFRLTADEAIALVLGLAGVRGGRALAGRLGAALARAPQAGHAADRIGVGPTPSEHLERVLDLARAARDGHRKVEIVYAGSAREPAARTVHPHQIVRHGRWSYVIAWCERAGAFRHFRGDRVLDARLTGDAFTPRRDFRPIAAAEMLVQSEETLAAEVAFDGRIRRWVEERHPGGRELPDGRYGVVYRVADAGWFVREVLQYGDGAEVLGPPSLREAVRRAVG
jgi:proteasome accessory factor C